MEVYNLMAINVLAYEKEFENENYINNFKVTGQVIRDSIIYKKRLLEKIDNNIAEFCLDDPKDNYYLMLFILKYKSEVIKDFEEKFVLNMLKYGKESDMKPYEAILTSKVKLTPMMIFEIIDKKDSIKTVEAIIKNEQIDLEKKFEILSGLTEEEKKSISGIEEILVKYEKQRMK